MTTLVRDLPSIVVVSVHKGASTFLAEDLTAAVSQVLPDVAVTKYGSELILGADPASLAVPPSGSLVVRLYPDDVDGLIVEGADEPKFDGTKLVLVYRDPRDAAISFYYSAVYSHSTDPDSVPDSDKFLEMRATLQSVSMSEAVASCGWPAIAEFKAVRALATRYPDAMVSTYEELVTDYSGWLRRFVNHVGWPVEAVAPIEQLTAGSFIPPAEMLPHEHKRRITPGNWREVFDNRLTTMFEQACGAEMRDAGYHW